MQNKSLLFLVSILFQTLLFSNDILTDYRIHGIDNIEKHMDQELAKEMYWQEYLKTKSTPFGYTESYKNILKCDKEQSTLSVYKKDANNTWIQTRAYSAYIGKNRGNKFKEGDLKTPVGIYNITKKISNVDSFYGPLALVTSYPNTYDKYNGKNGHGIWIHGLPTNKKRDKFTKGCIAIQNKSIKCLDKHIDITKTLLIIDEKAENNEVSKDDLATIFANLYAWRYAWIYNNLDDYLNFYSKKFIRFDGKVFNAFRSYKTRIFQKQESKKIIFSNLNILAYPNAKDIYQISFTEYYKSNSFEFSGDKILIVKLSKNSMKILTEK